MNNKTLTPAEIGGAVLTVVVTGVLAFVALGPCGVLAVGVILVLAAFVASKFGGRK